MSDLISRRAVINEIERWIGYIDGDMIARINIGINKLPSADRPRGEWIMHGEPPMYVIECSQCGQKYFNHALQEKANFCSNCGADMRGGDK